MVEWHGREDSSWNFRTGIDAFFWQCKSEPIKDTCCWCVELAPAGGSASPDLGMIVYATPNEGDDGGNTRFGFAEAEQTHPVKSVSRA